MDLLGDAIITSSKAGSLILSRIAEASVVPSLRIYPDAHVGPVKACAWRAGAPWNFASAGNDKLLKVFDVRCAETDTPAVTFASSLHTQAINTVAWKPAAADNSSFHILTSSFDRTLALSDIRFPKCPIFYANKHFTNNRKASSSSANSIHRPIFFRGGLFIATTGDAADKPFVYDAQTGQCLGTINVPVGSRPQLGVLTPKSTHEDYLLVHSYHRLHVLNLGKEMATL